MNTIACNRIGSFLTVMLCAASLRAADVPIVLPPDAPSNVRIAAEDLAKDLGRLYPQDRFSLVGSLPTAGKAILLGQISDESVRTRLGIDVPTKPESFSVRAQKTGDLELGIIAGADARGVAFGVYQLLSQLGCGFHLSGDALPAPRTDAFDFAGWGLENAPLVRERLVFNWHNFLSGCSTWNFSDWQKWTAQSQKMGFNAIMVHAYGNNPMAGFNFQGTIKPVGYLSTTAKGRDWSTMHVTDVRRIFGGEVFDRSVFGSEAALVPDAQRTTAAQSLMQRVFADAGQRGMGVYFAVDVDTPSANPQELVTLLPESARFAITGVSSGTSGQSVERLWLPNPDTSEGYSFYRAQVDSLLNTYPEITKLVVWFRRDATPWMNLKATDLPAAWQKEYAAELARTPEAERFWRAPGLFAVGKIIRAFERALQDCHAAKTQIAAGTWGFEFLPGADRFFPAGVPLIGLDYDVIAERPQLGDSKSRALLRVIGAHRPVIPIVWAHHDDGHYIGRPNTPLPEFAAKLADAGAAGYGIIHWTTRPLDLYFASLAKQVWQETKDQPLGETCGEFAAESFGVQNREIMGRYLEAWITSAPRFARETGDRFIDRPLTDIAEVASGCRERLAMIAGADVSKATPEQRARLDYYRGLEEFIATFFETHGIFQESQELLKKGDLAGARKLMEQCRPGPVIEQFGRFSSTGGMSRGEQGLVVSMNTRWLSHIIRFRQVLGMEPIRYRFGPTQHDPLAQSAGRFTFHFATDQQLWQTLGAAETGLEIFVVPESLRGTNELCSSGIESDKPLEFSMQPILSPGLFRKPIFYTLILYPAVHERGANMRIGVWHYILLMALNFSSGF
jgi:hypothetical protein